MTTWIVTLSGRVEIAAETAELAIEAAENLVLGGWAPSVHATDIEPMTPCAQKLKREMGIAEAELRRKP